MREAELRDEHIRTRRGVTVREAILSQPWQDAPAQPKRSHRPLCHADPERRSEFIETYRAIVADYLAAAAPSGRGACSRRVPRVVLPAPAPVSSARRLS